LHPGSSRIEGTNHINLFGSRGAGQQPVARRQETRPAPDTGPVNGDSDAWLSGWVPHVADEAAHTIIIRLNGLLVRLKKSHGAY
jgi:hypothetical protein